MMIFSSAFPATYYSICNGGNWSNPLCWSLSPGGPPCSCVPLSADDVVIQTDMVIDIDLTGGTGISGSLTIEAGASLITTLYDLEIKNSGLLTVNGILEVQDLTFSNGSTVIISATGDVTVHGNFSNNNNSDGVTLDGALAIYGTAYNGNGGEINGSGNISTYGGAFTGTGTFGPGIVFNNPLPVILLSFSAGADEKGNEIKWSTASEPWNNFFTLERTLDGINFVIAATIAGKGSQTNGANYVFMDPVFLEAEYFYRLKQTDFNGISSYSNMISVRRKKKAAEFMVYPTLTSGSVHVSFTSSRETSATIAIYDFSGKEFYSGDFECSKGNNDFNINLKDRLLPGAYFLKFNTELENFSGKIIVE